MFANLLLEPQGYLETQNFLWGLHCLSVVFSIVAVMVSITIYNTYVMPKVDGA